MAEETRVTLLTRPGCHLCEEARAVVADVAAQTGTAWTELSITEDPALERRYTELVPVVLVDGEQHACWRVDPGRLRATLSGEGRRARRSWRRPWRLPWRHRTP